MAQSIAGIRGMRALPPEQAGRLRRLEALLADCAESFGYGEIRLPVLERSELFLRSIGEATDIVSKEMYSFAARDGESLSLRPEGTAGAVRAAIEQGLTQRQSARVWYTGPMFRYERPQKGRSRQFWQFGAEAMGLPGPEVEVELLQLCQSAWQRLGVGDRLELQIASLGNDASRDRYRLELVDFLQAHKEQLDAHSVARLDSNPLRILDSKSPDTQQLLASAPLLRDYLDEASKEHFQRFCTLLDAAGIAYAVNPLLVRGLDYYCHTVFEWVAERDLGAQSTVCAGGRYDGLFALLGGEAVPAAGFALGLDRLLLLLEGAAVELPAEGASLFLAVPSAEDRAAALRLAGQLRQAPAIAGKISQVQTCLENTSLKAQMRQANSRGFDYVVLAGRRELDAGEIRVRHMGEGVERVFQLDAVAELAHWLDERIGA